MSLAKEGRRRLTEDGAHRSGLQAEREREGERDGDTCICMVSSHKIALWVSFTTEQDVVKVLIAV